MANAVCSMLSPSSRGSKTDCARRKSSAVRAAFKSLRAASICSAPLAVLAMILSPWNHDHIIHVFNDNLTKINRQNNAD
jgi:hypothetical protein